MTGYEITADELYTSDGYAAKATPAVTGKVAVGGGFRFIPDQPSDPEDAYVTVKECGPYAGVVGGGERWYAAVKVSVPGTLRVFAVMVDA